MAFYYNFSMIQHRKAACTDFLMMNTWMFETCRIQYNWIESLIKKVYILLVNITYVISVQCTESDIVQLLHSGEPNVCGNTIYKMDTYL